MVEAYAYRYTRPTDIHAYAHPDANAHTHRDTHAHAYSRHSASAGGWRRGQAPAGRYRS